MFFFTWVGLGVEVDLQNAKNAKDAKSAKGAKNERDAKSANRYQPKVERLKFFIHVDRK